MENYRRAGSVEQPSVCPFADLPEDTPQIRVKDGSKIRNLLRFALSRMEAKPQVEEAQEPPPPPCKHLVFTATGRGVAKAITCVEIVKRRVKGLHQLTRLLYSTAVEAWEPLQPAAGLDSLTVSRNLPAIWILLSTAPLDPTQPGYQAPGRYDALWAQTACREEGGPSTGVKPGPRRKRGGAAGGAAGGGRGRAGRRGHHRAEPPAL